MIKLRLSDISAIFHQVDKCSIQYLYTHYLQIREWDKAYFYAEVLYRNGDNFTLLTIQNAHFFGLGRFKQDYVKAVEFGVSADLCRIGGFDPICIRIIIQWIPIRFGLSLRLVSKR